MKREVEFQENFKVYLYYFFFIKYIRQDIEFKVCDGNFVRGNIYRRFDYFNFDKIKIFWVQSEGKEVYVFGWEIVLSFFCVIREMFLGLGLDQVLEIGC